MCNTTVRQNASEKRQSEIFFFRFFVVIGNNLPVSNKVQGPKYTGETKLYSD